MNSFIIFASVELVAKKNDKLVKKDDTFINLECESYYRVDGASKYQLHKSLCNIKIYKKVDKYIAVSATMSINDISNWIRATFINYSILSSTENKEAIAKDEGLQGILLSLPKLNKVEFTTHRYTTNCKEDDECDCNI